jgi:hypothetical protein
MLTVDAAAKTAGVTQKNFCSASPGIDPHTHKKISTAASTRNSARRSARGLRSASQKLALSHGNVELCGFHCKSLADIRDGSNIAPST